jgi:hypothetical protein
MDGEEWQGLTVRTCHGTVLGVVVGVFAEVPLAGRLRVQGELASRRHPAWVLTGTLVFGIPRHAVAHRTRHNLMLDVTLAEAHTCWFVHVVQREVAC